MIQFHQTPMGKKYYDHQLPEQIKAMNRLAAAIEKQNELMSDKDVDESEQHTYLINYIGANGIKAGSVTMKGYSREDAVANFHKMFPASHYAVKSFKKLE